MPDSMEKLVKTLAILTAIGLFSASMYWLAASAMPPAEKPADTMAIVMTVPRLQFLSANELFNDAPRAGMVTFNITRLAIGHDVRSSVECSLLFNRGEKSSGYADHLIFFGAAAAV